MRVNSEGYICAGCGNEHTANLDRPIGCVRELEAAAAGGFEQPTRAEIRTWERRVELEQDLRAAQRKAEKLETTVAILRLVLKEEPAREDEER